MTEDKNISFFLSTYEPDVQKVFFHLRKIICDALPGVTEQVDVPAKMVAYCYGQRYIEMVCIIIPSKKGIKLGFYRGVDLADPGKLLQGTGKISRYVPFIPGQVIDRSAILDLLQQGLVMYEQRLVQAKKG